jgi:hypothetical protein
MDWTPLTDYKNYDHVLQAGAVFVHPGNGNVYSTACEKQTGTRQNLSIYRSVNGAAPTLFRRYIGTVDSAAQFTWGACCIGHGGGLWIATSMVIPGAIKVTQTGFQGCYLREANVDDPWGEPRLYTRIADLEARVRALEEK